MTKIRNQIAYKPDTEISGKDYFIGSDYDKPNKDTVNFRVEELGGYYNMTNGIRNFDYVFYQHASPSSTPTDGYFYANDNEQDPNWITHFIFSKKTLRGKEVSQFFQSITAENPFTLIISQKQHLNSIFFFNIDEVIDLGNCYQLNVSKVFFHENKVLEYTVSYATFNLKSQGATIDQDNIIRFINVGYTPIINSLNYQPIDENLISDYFDSYFMNNSITITDKQIVIFKIAVVVEVVNDNNDVINKYIQNRKYYTTNGKGVYAPMYPTFNGKGLELDYTQQAPSAPSVESVLSDVNNIIFDLGDITGNDYLEFINTIPNIEFPQGYPLIENSKIYYFKFIDNDITYLYYFDELNSVNSYGTYGVDGDFTFTIDELVLFYQSDITYELPSITNTSDLINDGADGTSTYVEADEIPELVQDAIGNILVNSVAITFDYDDDANTITADVNPNSITSNELANNINISEFINNANYTTVAASQAYADALVVSIFRPAGSWDASGNTFPTTGTGTAGAIRQGDTYNTTVAGTPSGFEKLDIGDNFYALVSSPGQTASNWAKFEANTQQATESFRGTTKITTQAIVEDNTTTNDTDSVTAKKFWLGWTKGLTLTTFFNAILGTVLSGLSASSGTFTSTDTILVAFNKIKYLIDNIASIYSPIASPTFTGTVTTPEIIVSSETASRVAIIDGYKKLKSADTTTYPNLTELSYLKGVNSALQTQIDTPQITITTGVSIDTTTLVSGLSQKGRNVVISNGASAINYTCNGTDGFAASYVKIGSAAVTFVAGSGRTLVQMDGTAILNGIAGSRAAIASIGTVDYLYITNY